MQIAKLLPVVCGLAVHAMAQASAPAPVSVAGANCISASAPSYLPTLSANGRYIVFVSNAKNLTTNENLAPYLDVFRYDLLTGDTILISRAANGAGGANASSASPSVSSDGQSIAFASEAGDLLPNLDGNGAADIFLANGNAGALSLVSAGRDGSSVPNAVSTRNLPLHDKPRISADGRWVVFESFATNLTAETDVNNDSDVFLRDTVSNRTVLVSVALEGGATASGHSELAGITPNGGYVLFASTATDVAVGAPTTGYLELYLRDLAAGATTWIRHSNSTPNGGVNPAPYNCRWAVMSRDAAVVLYKVEFPSFPYARVHLYDRQADSNVVLAIRAPVGTPIHMSSDGRFIAYDTYEPTYRVVLWDRQSGTRTVVSGPDFAYSPVVSEDGSIVAFLSGNNNLPYQIYYRNTVTSQLRRLTQTLGGAPAAKDHAGSAFAIDPAGQFIVFDSMEDNLVADDRNQASDIFVHDVASGETRLVSRAHQDKPSLTALGAASVTNSCLSTDGNRLLFLSADSTLVRGDTNRFQDAFLRDLRSGQTFALSTNNNGLFSSNTVRHAILSANGRYALLGVTSPRASILRKDLETGETVFVISNVQFFETLPLSTVPMFSFSISANGQMITYPVDSSMMVADMQSGLQTNLTPFGSWSEPLISPDGRYVTYVNNDTRSLVISDLSTRQSANINSAYIRGTAFSPNGESVVYVAQVTGGSGINLYSISARTNTPVCSNCGTPSVSADGRFVAYEKLASAPRQIEVKDMVTGKTTAVTGNISGTGGANADATRPIISADGRFVAYTTKATNLTTDAPNGWNNLYIYDRLQGTTIRITGVRGNTGYGSGSSSRPVMGPDGRTLVFQSFASDFVAGDFNDTRDLFLLKLGEGDADNDGMSDSWEQTYFSTTDRDGTGDFDNDGQSDLAEYLAGTNPADNQSVLEVLTITSVNTGERQLIWRAESGKSYRIEYKTDLQGGTWTSLGQVITASGPTASATDATATTEKRFYRVALAQ